MSASLVGSEMCIRDRCNNISAAAQQAAGRCRKHQEAAGSCRKLQKATAVSYTHLTLPTICSV
eukprot:9975265-Alexandrium_andersonii.AAC.1